MAPAARAAGVLTVSDRAAAGERADVSGPALAEGLEALGWDVSRREVVPDDRSRIAGVLRDWADEVELALVLTTGGTGLAPRDVTPEATRDVAEREAPGIAEALRAAALEVTPHGMLSRGAAVVRGTTLIVNLPGSPKAVVEGLAVLAPVLDHAVALVSGSAASRHHHRSPTS
ncbi:MAG: MogA/MoaB family molybdenum cofactor biosynthesis protein [Gemmatimonadetes bacterium]|nr:MogA/MoaB family molybdenum cofactor biosynthesis protein [Gemmatimonadota bacterium]